MENEINISTSDNFQYKVPREIINMLKNLQNNIEQIGTNLKLSALKSTEFQYIIEYCNHHKFVEPPLIVRPLRNNDLKKCVADEWDADFINAFDFERVTDLLLAAELLGSQSLMDLCYARMALFFRVTPISQLKEFFQLSESEFTESDFKEVKEGNKWLMSLTEDRVKELDSNNN